MRGQELIIDIISFSAASSSASFSSSSRHFPASVHSTLPLQTPCDLALRSEKKTTQRSGLEQNCYVPAEQHPARGLLIAGRCPLKSQTTGHFLERQVHQRSTCSYQEKSRTGSEASRAMTIRSEVPEPGSPWDSFPVGTFGRSGCLRIHLPCAVCLAAVTTSTAFCNWSNRCSLGPDSSTRRGHFLSGKIWNLPAR